MIGIDEQLVDVGAGRYEIRDDHVLGANNLPPVTLLQASRHTNAAPHPPYRTSS